jgi:tRNA modification GTPase
VSGRLDQLMSRTASLVAEGRRGRLVRDGLSVAIVGRPNVGKSSLFNALAGASRAIVTEIPGTTRDLVTEVVNLEGLRVTLVDTAGVRPAHDVVEAEGVARARQASETADLVLVVVDGSGPLEPDDHLILADTANRRRLLVSNKADLGGEAVAGFVAVSARTGEGLDGLRGDVVRALDVEWLDDPPAVTNLRHVALLERAHEAMSRGREAASAALPEEFVLADLQDARAALEEISGRRTPDEVLAHIFSRFCIGK